MADSIIPEDFDQQVREEAGLSSDIAASHALAVAHQDAAGRAAAAAFLASHKRFVDLQIAYFDEDRQAAAHAARLRRAADWLKVLVQVSITAIGFAVVVALGGMFWSAVASRAVVVSEFDVPTSLAAQGNTGQQVAGQVLDVLVQIRDATRAAARTHRIEGAWTNRIELRLPQTTVSIGQISDALHRMFGHDVRIGGSLTLGDDGTRFLTVRGDGLTPKTFRGRPGAMDQLVREAGEYVYGEAQPTLFVDYLAQTGRVADAIPFLENAFPRASDLQRPELANFWGDILLRENRVAEAADRYRLALRIDPRHWRAWNNLVGVLIPTQGEEAAYHAGLAMRRAGRSRLFAKGPSATDEMNFAQLTLDPGAVIQGALEAGRLASDGGVEFDDSSWVAEQKAVQHDWPAVEQYLAESPRGDLTTAFDNFGLGGQQALEEGDPATAVRRFAAADKLWQAAPSLQGFFPDFPCGLAFAHAAAGEFAEAEKTLGAESRFARCRARRADALDLAGDWPAAQAQYRRAEAAAPDLAYAYEREGAAWLRHGSARAAIERLTIAQRNSRNWADPLKDLGDAYAQMGNWQFAEASYLQALTLAPNWQALQQASAAARHQDSK